MAGAIIYLLILCPANLSRPVHRDEDYGNGCRPKLIVHIDKVWAAYG